MDTRAPSQRLYALDSLRATMMLLGLLLHSAISYGRIPYGDAWPFKDASTHPFFDQIVICVHIFRMPVFYVMAGFFAALLYVRRGAAGLARNRVSRILLPFVVGWVVLVPLIIAGFGFAQVAQSISVGVALTEIREGASGTQPLFPDTTAHLWFLYYLMLFYVASLALMPVVSRLPGAWRAAAMGTFSLALRSRWRPLIFAVPTALTLYLMPSGVLVTSTSFVPDPKVFLAYGVFFAFGWLLYSRKDLLETFTRHARLQILLAVPVVFVNFAGISRQLRAPEGNPVAHLATVASGALMVWLLIFGITGVFVRYLDRPSPTVRYVTDASYWLYLIHLPFTIWIPGLLAMVSWPAAAKFAAVLALSIPIWWASYEFGVRNTIIGKVLNGRRYPRGLPVLVDPPAGPPSLRVTTEEKPS